QWALAMRLNGTAVDSVTGSTLGGAPVQRDGSWLPATLESARLTGANLITPLPAGSAILINFGGGSLTAANAAGGQAEAAERHGGGFSHGHHAGRRAGAARWIMAAGHTG